MMKKYLALVFTCIVLSSGCASQLIPYKTTTPENFELSANTDSNVSAGVDIYSVNQSCELLYLGSIDVGESTRVIGISIDEPSYLVIRFSKSSFWSAHSSSMSQETFFQAEKDFRYEMNLSYVDAIYDIQLTKINLKTENASRTDLEGPVCTGQ
jgi:hypothetical protein